MNIAAIVLAAGASTRLGHSKQLLEYDGETLIRRAANAVLEIDCSPVVVVIGADAQRARMALGDLNVIAAMNHDWESGIASSIAKGVRTIRKAGNVDGVLVTLADQPLVTASALERLTAAFDDSHRLVASAYAGTVGVPAIFGNEFFDELESLTGDTGAARLLRARTDLVTSIALPEAETDIDSKEDLRVIGQ